MIAMCPPAVVGSLTLPAHRGDHDMEGQLLLKAFGDREAEFSGVRCVAGTWPRTEQARLDGGTGKFRSAP